MVATRELCDLAEAACPAHLWSLPTYAEMLFDSEWLDHGPHVGDLREGGNSGSALADNVLTKPGKAIGMGALHGLQKLNLINCTTIKTLPESIHDLLELNTILLDGCVQLRSLPDEMSRLASLRVFSIINCHYMDDEACKDLPSLAKVIRTKEEWAALQEAGGVGGL